MRPFVFDRRLAGNAGAMGLHPWFPNTSPSSFAKMDFYTGFTLMILVCVYYAKLLAASVPGRLQISTLTVTQARQRVVGKRVLSRLPWAPPGDFTLRLSWSDWRWWMYGVAFFFATSLPYWLLIVWVGPVVGVGVAYFAFRLPRRILIGLGAVVILLVATLYVIKRRRRRRVSQVDKSAMLVLAYMAGAEKWCEADKWRASMLYVLRLQERGVPLLMTVTGTLSHRFLMSVYCNQVKCGVEPSQALSRVLALLSGRMLTVMGVYLPLAVVKAWVFWG